MSKVIATITSPGAFALEIKKARERLEKCRDYSEAKDIRDTAKAMQVYARAKEDGVAAQNAAGAVVLKAEACMGRMTREVPRQGRGGDRKSDQRTTVDVDPSTESLGLTRAERQRYEELAEADDSGALDQYLEDTQAAGDRVTRKGALEAATPHVSNNSGNNEWYTPAQYIEAAREVLGKIDLDPASNAVANETVKARKFYTESDNGLEKPWRGSVWMNPPYAQPLIAQFCERVASQHEEGKIDAAIVLVNNGTESKWGQRLLAAAKAVCFPSGRIRFVDQSGNPSGAPLQGQMLVYLGDDLRAFKKAFSQFGVVLKR